MRESKNKLFLKHHNYRLLEHVFSIYRIEFNSVWFKIQSYKSCWPRCYAVYFSNDHKTLNTTFAMFALFERYRITSQFVAFAIRNLLIRNSFYVRTPYLAIRNILIRYWFAIRKNLQFVTTFGELWGTYRVSRQVSRSTPSPITLVLGNKKIWLLPHRVRLPRAHIPP